MKDSDITKYRNLLLDLRQDMSGQGAVSVKVKKAGLDHEILNEDDQPLAEMSQVIASNRNQNRAASLDKINAALNRLQNNPDEFGLCQDCDEKIPPKRLELMPFAELCAQCQGVRDEANKPMRRRHLTDYK
jgi:DnaK suppressor protein